jgi:hypothetical protein
MRSQNTRIAKQKGDQETSDAAVRVKKWVDGFKLHMNQCHFNQNWQTAGIFMDKLLKV